MAAHRSADQIVIVGDRDSGTGSTMVNAVFDVSLPNRVLQVVEDAATLPAGHPAYGKIKVGGEPTAYICRGQTCSLPITDVAELLRALNGDAS